MRALVLVPLTLAIVVAVAFVVCRLAGIDAHLRELIAAGMTCFIAGELAGIPLMLARGGDQAAIAQAGLIGTVVHLFVCIGIAGVIVFAHLPLGAAFLYWLMALYWVTLIVLVAAFVKAVRSAPMTRQTN